MYFYHRDAESTEDFVFCPSGGGDGQKPPAVSEKKKSYLLPLEAGLTFFVWQHLKANEKVGSQSSLCLCGE
jgi:hypothetical protein